MATAAANLTAAKAACAAVCAPVDAEVTAIPQDQLSAAIVAHAVMTSGADGAVSAALAAGPLRMLSDDHIAAVSQVATAAKTHADHADQLAAAYADFAAASRAEAGAAR